MSRVAASFQTHVYRSTRNVSHIFALSPGSKRRTIGSTHLSMREIVRRIMFASLRVSTDGACFRRRRLHARVPSCCHVGASATNHVRARWAIRLSTIAQARHVAVLRVSAFPVQTTGPRRPRVRALAPRGARSRSPPPTHVGFPWVRSLVAIRSSTGVDSGERRSEGRFVFRRVGLPSSPRGIAAVGSQSTGSRIVPRFGGTTLAGR